MRPVLRKLARWCLKLPEFIINYNGLQELNAHMNISADYYTDFSIITWTPVLKLRYFPIPPGTFQIGKVCYRVDRYNGRFGFIVATTNLGIEEPDADVIVELVPNHKEPSRFLTSPLRLWLWRGETWLAIRHDETLFGLMLVYGFVLLKRRLGRFLRRLTRRSELGDGVHDRHKAVAK